MPRTPTLAELAQQLFHAALPGTAPDNDAWLMRKCRVVDRFGMSSFRVGEQARHDGTTFEAQMRRKQLSAFLAAP